MTCFKMRTLERDLKDALDGYIQYIKTEAEETCPRQNVSDLCRRHCIVLVLQYRAC